MNLDSITCLILARNESANIERTLSSLQKIKTVLVVDSNSDDETISIVSSFPNARYISRAFDNHTNQWNYGLTHVQTPWVLTLDSDYVCPKALFDEISALGEDAGVYFARFRYCVFGRPLRGSLYPPRAVLFQTKQCCYVEDGHTQLLDVKDKRIAFLTTRILHDDRKPLVSWLDAQRKYADLEVTKLMQAKPSDLSWKDRIRLIPGASTVILFFYCMFYKGLIINGRYGFYYTLQRCYFELLLSLKLFDYKLQRANDGKK